MRLLIYVFILISHENIKFLTREFQDRINSVIHAIVFFDQELVENKILLKSKVRRCRDDDETLSSRMNNDSHRKQLKDLFARDECQEKDDCQKKKLKFKKNVQIFIDQTTSL